MALRFKNKEVFPLEGTNKLAYEVEDQWVYEINVADDANRPQDTTNWGFEIILEWYLTTVSMDLNVTASRLVAAPAGSAVAADFTITPISHADGRWTLVIPTTTYPIALIDDVPELDDPTVDTPTLRVRLKVKDDTRVNAVPNIDQDSFALIMRRP